MELSTLYVYEGVEVRKTGRTAVKQLRRPSNRQTEMVLIEITPCDGINVWHKWVREEDLYTIQTP